MGQRARRRIASKSGNATVEFALVVPIFFLLVFGFVAFSIIFAGYCGATYASQMGLRYAIVHGNNSLHACTNTDITTVTARYLWAAPKNGTTVTTTWSPNNSPGSTVTINISLSYNTGIPFSALTNIKVGAVAKGTIVF